ncbi:hypothetical protein [Prosthecobacter sp.]|uniref:hypothetical protein n=1 Tax=Prosthecobacter sp. TaxID=1965333 RepID=UPI0037853076
MKVEIRNYHNAPEGRIDCTWTLAPNGHAVCDDADQQEMLEYGGICGSHGRLYYPKDGEDFLRNYPLEFANSSFIRAIIVE